MCCGSGGINTQRTQSACRCTVSQLADNQAAELANRCSMVGLQRQTKMALEEVTRRPAAMADFGARRAWLMSSAIARSDRRYDLAFECLDKARGAIAGEDAFRQNLELDVRELTYRLDDPDDPALIPLLHRFRDRYLHKIPEIEGVIAEQLEHAGCSHLVVELTGGLATIESDSGATLWTPNQPATESAAASGGLWLPGQ